MFWCFLGASGQVIGRSQEVAPSWQESNTALAALKKGMGWRRRWEGIGSMYNHHFLCQYAMATSSDNRTSMLMHEVKLVKKDGKFYFQRL